jgi:hypothetical protein
MDVEVIAPPAAESEVRAQAEGLCEPRSLADQGTQELSSGEEPAAPPSPPKPKAKPRARAQAKRAPKSEEIVDLPEPIVEMRERSSQPIVDLPEPIVEMPAPKAKARVRKAAPKKTRPPSVEPPAHWASLPQVGHSSFDLMPRIDAALHDYIRQQEWADKQRREEVVRSFRLF